jgi:peptide/nickel transport system substrate-binding protein
MSLYRRWRLAYLIIINLAAKYTKALLVGLLTGFLLTFGVWRAFPLMSQLFFTPVERIGLVGDFTPTTLPLSIQRYISIGLTTINEDGSAGPGLAESWEATDSGKTFVFHLKPNYLWHNGKPVEAKDVNYNIRNVSFEPLDPATLRVTLPTAYSPFPVVVAKPIFQAGLRGFGPYRVANIRLHGDNVNYLKLVPVERSNKKSYEIRFYNTEAAAITAYKLGEIDEIEDLSSSYDLQHWGKTKVDVQVKYNRIVSVFFNLTDQLLKEKSFRHALAFGIPALSGDKAVSPISKTSWSYTDKVKNYTYDAIQAKKLLSDYISSTESGKLTISTFDQYADIAQEISKSWNSLGLSTDVKVVNVVNPDYQVLVSAQEVPPDPDQYPFWHQTQTQTNITHYANVKIDKLLEDGRQELDVENRKKIYADFQRRLVDDAPAIFLSYAQTYTIKRR